MKLILFLIILGGLYFWLTSPAGSMWVFVKAVEWQQVDFALKFIDINAIIDNCWARSSANLLQFVSQHLDFKPIADIRAEAEQKDNLKTYLQNLWPSEIEVSEDYTRFTSFKNTVHKIFSERSKITRTGEQSYFEFSGTIIPGEVFGPDVKIKVILEKIKAGFYRHWKIVDIHGWE